jgi:hypothetical protein
MENAVVVNASVFDHELTAAELKAWPTFLVAARIAGVDGAPDIVLEIGDLYAGGRWTRNVEGVQVALPVPLPDGLDDGDVESAAVEEALKILRGEAV